MRKRILELEHQLSNAHTPIPAPTHPVHVTSSLSASIDILQDSRAFGHVHAIARGISHKNRVFGQSHWMNGFVVFRDLIEMIEPSFRNPSSSMLSGLHRAKMLARVIKSQRSPEWPTLPTNVLPPMDLCDALVKLYLRTMEPLYRVLHVPTFQQEYEAVWTNTDKPSTSFMMQLKIILAIGAIFHDEKCSMRAEATCWIYEVQTWLLSPNSKSRLGIQNLQTSILLLLAREMIDVGSELIWISAGSLLREAIYIGLHKDPAQLPRMSIFKSEMHRRIWNTILDLNLQASLVSGGPCLFSLEDFTTEPPGNYSDEELVASDPHAMPDHVFTEASVAIALRNTLPVRLTVVKFLNDVASTGTYEETLRIDTELRASYKALRRTLQAYATNDALSSKFATDAIDFIMHRYISSLHIPYFNASLHEAMYAFSRKSVLDTSLQIWKLATSPGRPPHSPTTTEPDIARLCRCGAGFFRAFTFHASTFLVVELRSQILEEDSVPRPDLLNIPLDATNMVLRAIEAGETSVKGYILLSVLAAQIDGIERRVGEEDIPALLGGAAEVALQRCIPMLERIAGQGTGGVDSQTEEFDFQISPDFMEDWDLVMSDMFNFDGVDAFLT
ncbi:hypothetical protein CC86DRAFT_318946 [Ophiobolus disseminans]|uniref:Xylanolytic transcriptional activator regulatory domain-containing protein n=1 Tax=Ophiobolus disseminans TaxID=1469910 RepID=A0A6A7A8E2_9PLEO|nr:hypothetical protein CC86DRAFT_318946 [Ophiobolus disseminans]